MNAGLNPSEVPAYRGAVEKVDTGTARSETTLQNSVIPRPRAFKHCARPWESLLFQQPHRLRGRQQPAGDCGEGGFTLIEVVIALGILGAGMVILLETHLASLRLLDDAQEQVFVSSLMETVVGAAEQEVLFGSVEGQGDFGQRYPDYSYSFEAVQPDEENVPGLFEVIVRVQGPVEQSEMTFYVYDSNQETEETEGGQTNTRGGSNNPRGRNNSGSSNAR